MYTINDQCPTVGAQLATLTEVFTALNHPGINDAPKQMEGQLLIKPVISDRTVNLNDLPHSIGALPGPDSVAEMFWTSLNYSASRLLAEGNLYELLEFYLAQVPEIDVLVYLHRDVPIPPQPVHFSSGRVRYNFVRHEIAALERQVYLTPKNFLPGLEYDRQEFIKCIIARITLA